MGSYGGRDAEGYGDNSPGSSNAGGTSSSGSERNSRGATADADEMRAMLHSPSTDEYANYYAAKAAQNPNSFMQDLSNLGSYVGNTAMNALRSSFADVAGIPDQIAQALGLGPQPSGMRDMTKTDGPLGPMDAQALGDLATAINNLGRSPTADEVGLVAGMMEEAGTLSAMDKFGMNMAQVPGQMVQMALNPMASMTAARAGIDLANPMTQKAIGSMTGAIGSMVTNNINAQSLMERATGTGIAAGNVATRNTEMAGDRRGTGERVSGDRSGLGEFQMAGAALNRGPGAVQQGSGKEAGATAKTADVTGAPGAAKPAAPMAKRQRGSRLGLSDYFTLTDNLGVGDESLELRNRVLGGA